MIKKIGLVIVLVVFSYLSLHSLFTPGYFPMHDDAQIARVLVMGKALSHGQFPVRTVSELGYGYGYPLFNFYGPLPYYFGGSLYALGIPSLIATKIMIGVGIVIGVFGVYLLVSRLFGTLSGIVGATAFTFFPYRAVQLFVRGAIGELWAVSFIPFILLGFFLVHKQSTRTKGVLIGIIGLSGVILSHTVYAYLVIGFLASVLLLYWIYRLIRKNFDRDIFICHIGIVLLSLDLTAFFWLPALLEMKYTNVFSVIGPSANLYDHFVCLPQLWNSLWGFGGSTVGCLDGLSFKLGKLHILLALLSTVVFIFIHKTGKNKKAMIVGLFITSASVFMVLPVSAFIWKIVPISSFVQYPWRLLGVTGIGMALIIPYVLIRLPVILKFIVALSICIALITLNIGLFKPDYIYPLSLEAAESLEDIRFRASNVSNEYLPNGIYIPTSLSDTKTRRIGEDEHIRVISSKETETYGLYEIHSDGVNEMKLNMAYYPWWRYSINDKLVKPELKEGTPILSVLEGTSEIEIRYQNTVIQTVANVLSLITLISIGVLYAKKTNS